MLALRLAVFEHLVDIGRIAELRGIERARRRALGRRRDDPGARSRPVPRSRRQSRCSPRRRRSSATSRSATGARIGGSIAHADPAAEYPAVALTLDARIEVASVPRPPHHRGARLLRRALEHQHRSPTSSSIGVSFPTWGRRSGFAVEEFARRHGDFAIAGATVGIELDDDDRIRALRDRPHRHGLDTRARRCRRSRGRGPSDPGRRARRGRSAGHGSPRVGARRPPRLGGVPHAGGRGDGGARLDGGARRRHSDE